MTTCAKCKHWYNKDSSQIDIPGRGLCLMANSVKGGEKTVYSQETSNAHATATVAATFGYQMVICGLETTPDFGCNQFEEK